MGNKPDDTYERNQRDERLKKAQTQAWDANCRLARQQAADAASNAAAAAEARAASAAANPR